MNKGRLEAFTDAIVAIIVTIMVLEIKVPESNNLQELIKSGEFLHTGGAFFAYLIGFIFIGVAWYNHHYMFSLAKHISKKIYWLNNFWLLTMSLLPFTTAWAGEQLNNRMAIYFYMFVFILWGEAYRLLSKAIAETSGDSVEEKIKSMFIYKILRTPITIGLHIVALVLVYFYPPIGLIYTLLFVIIMAFKTSPDSDSLFTKKNQKENK